MPRVGRPKVTRTPLSSEKLLSVKHAAVKKETTKTKTEKSLPPRTLEDRDDSGVVHTLPEEFRKAIEADPVVKDLWIDLTPLARNEWICWVTSAKKDETRNRRITVGLDKMRGGMRRPCCWPGCPHRASKSTLPSVRTQHRYKCCLTKP